MQLGKHPMWRSIGSVGRSIFVVSERNILAQKRTTVGGGRYAIGEREVSTVDLGLILHDTHIVARIMSNNTV